MKLNSLRIMGMHNVVDTTYTLHDILTYFHGPNGAGKSTILESIQLLLLGYIPGYSKTNESIMKHCPGVKLEVQGTFDDGTTIIRWWIRKGTTVSSSAVKVPKGSPIDKDLGTTFSGTLLETDELELPIYNFSEFKDMTANKLKEWFISFLPPAETSIDWNARLTSSMKERSAILDEELLDSVLSTISDLSKESEGIKLVQNVNSYLKELQSFNKKEKERLEGTIQSLVHYDEELPDDDTIKDQLAHYTELLADFTSYEKTIQQQQLIERELSSFTRVDSTVTDISEAENYTELENQYHNIVANIDEVADQIASLESDTQAISLELNTLNSLSDICPYTKQKCDKMEDVIGQNVSKVEELTQTYKVNSDELARLRSEFNSLKQQKFNISSNLESLRTEYDRFFNLQKTLTSLSNSIACPSDLTKEEISTKISDLQLALSKVEANKRYSELIQTISNDKFKIENNLEVLKVWIKLTDANGLQTELTTQPFENLATQMNTYLSTMFNKETQAHFNLTSKANSFSFGLIRGNNYIEFDYLSSGERCLFMLAMMICLLDRSNTSLRMILVDDLIDHLDDNNASNVFLSLSTVDSVQFIIAGVKPCNDSNVCINLS